MDQYIPPTMVIAAAIALLVAGLGLHLLPSPPEDRRFRQVASVLLVIIAVALAGYWWVRVYG